MEELSMEQAFRDLPADWRERIECDDSATIPDPMFEGEHE